MAPGANNDAAIAKPRSIPALQWLNFFVRDIQTGVGPFLATYLAAQAGRLRGPALRAVLCTLTHTSALLVAIQVLNGVANEKFYFATLLSKNTCQAPNPA